MEPSISALPREKGIYALIVGVSRAFPVSIGRLGKRFVAGGYWVYVGSARGPGGLRARVDRHLSAEKNRRWHVDYILLSDSTRVSAVVYSTEEGARECELVKLLLADGLEAPIRNFGSSDCKERCPAHLLYCGRDLESCEERVVKAFLRAGLKPALVRTWLKS